MGFLGGQELLVILVIVILLFGAKKIPELAKGLGTGLKEFKKATSEPEKKIEEGTVSEPKEKETQNS